MKRKYLVLIISVISMVISYSILVRNVLSSRANIANPLITATLVPTTDPTTIGGPIVLGTPLPTPPLAENAIDPSNASQIIEVYDLGGPANLGVSDALFTQDGLKLAVARDGLTVWQLPEVEEIFSLPRLSLGITSLALSPDGQIAAIGNYENQGWVDLWDISTQERLRQHQGLQGANTLGFNAAGTLLAVGRGGTIVTVWDVETGDLINELKEGVSGCTGMDFHPELDQIAASGAGNVVRIWNAKNGQILTELSMENPPNFCRLTYLAYRPDGEMLAGAMFWERKIALWEGDSFAGFLTHPEAGTIWKISWSPNGRLLAAIENGGSKGQQLVIWDVADRNVIGIWEQWRSIGTFSPDGASLVTYRFEPHGGRLRMVSLPSHWFHVPLVSNDIPDSSK